MYAPPRLQPHPTKFGQLILRKIFEIVTTRCQIVRLKCTKFDFGWGSALQRAYSAPPDPLAGFKGFYFYTWWKMLTPICLYCLNCTKFGQLIVRKIFEIVTTRCQIVRLKCTKFDFGWGSTPDPAGGAYSAPPDPLAGFKGSYFKGGGKGGERSGGEGRLKTGPPWSPKPSYAAV